MKTRKIYGIPTIDKTEQSLAYPNPNEMRPSPDRAGTPLPPLEQRVGKYSWGSSEPHIERPARYQHVREAPKEIHDKPGNVLYRIFVKLVIMPLVVIALISVFFAILGGALMTFPTLEPDTEKEYLQKIRTEHSIVKLSDEQIVSIGKKSCHRLSGGEAISSILTSAESLDRSLRAEASASIREGIDFYCPGLK